MKIKPPLFLGNSNEEPDENLEISIGENSGGVNHDLPYRWNKESNMFEFPDGKFFYCPMSTDVNQKR